jgi:predicted dehydrogenase/threonine dehydrogenase-like Zn-dependent dehydrogenase
MKQIIQSFKTGETILEEIPAPTIRKGTVLIETTYSLVSLGTEKMLVEFGKSNLISKARQQPDKVKQVLDKIKTEGLLPTLEAVFNKLEQPLPLGYCNVGKVIAVGDGVSEFKIGDRVASNGQHAEIVCIPKNLVANIPDDVSDEEACFTVIGSIGLQGIRLLKPTLGETIVIIGLGLIGLITAQLLKANGCNVIGVDIDANKLAMCERFGIIPFNPKDGDIVKFVEQHTKGIGADGVIITASNKSNDIISQAAKMSRKRGRIILVGVIGLNISRSEFYEKELSFQVSCSYGPGRYDEDYEQKGVDYPISFVRWTEKRNFEAILNSISSKQLRVNELITEKVKLANFLDIYNSLGNNNSIASILDYTNNKKEDSRFSNTVLLENRSYNNSKGVIGIVGAGNFTKMTMLPALKGSGAENKYIASAGGVNSTALAKKYHFSHSTTNYQEILNDQDVDLVLITTRHNQHASQVVEALNHGKHVFVEKPLALNLEELNAIKDAYYNSNAKPTLTVGFNRRFSPHSVAVKNALGKSGPLNIIATMNAGNIPSNVWIHDLLIGGGRIIGEACHYIDLASYLTDSRVVSVCMNSLGKHIEEKTDNASILLKYEDGSNVVINYFSNGSKSYSKERIEVYNQERTIIIDNFRKTEAFGFKNFKGLKTSINKGHKSQFHELINRVKNSGSPLIDFDSLINTSKASFAAIQSLKENKWIDIQ